MAAKGQTPDAHQTIETRIGGLDFELGVPTEETAQKLYDEMDFQRAVQCYLWAVPIVGVEQSAQGLVHDTGAESGELALYDDFRSKSTGLGFNNNTPYIWGVINLAESGPVVMEYPAGPSAGALIDWWERPITDVGLPGADKGQGARYLFVGPGQETPTEADSEGYLVFHSRTLKTAFFLRTLDTDPAKAKTLREAARIYPYSQRHDPPPPKPLLLPKTDGELLIQAQPSGMAFWERLSQALSGEPGEDRDRFFMAMLKQLGIENDKPFSPDARQTKILEEAAVVGEAMAKNVAFNQRLEGTRYRSDSHWEYVVPPWFEVDQDEKNTTQLDERTGLYYEAFGMSHGSNTKIVGIGQTYIGAYRDKNGHPFDGGKTYRLRVAPNPPAKLFWSVTLYDIETRCLVQNETEIPDRVSHQDLDKNADGSVDI